MPLEANSLAAFLTFRLCSRTYTLNDWQRQIAGDEFIALPSLEMINPFVSILDNFTSNYWIH